MHLAIRACLLVFFSLFRWGNGTGGPPARLLARHMASLLVASKQSPLPFIDHTLLFSSDEFLRESVREIETLFFSRDSLPSTLPSLYKGSIPLNAHSTCEYRENDDRKSSGIDGSVVARSWTGRFSSQAELAEMTELRAPAATVALATAGPMRVDLSGDVLVDYWDRMLLRILLALHKVLRLL